LPSRRRHLSRTAIGLLLALAFWTVVGMLAVRLLDQPDVRRWIADQIASRLSGALQQPVRVEEARVSLYPPRLSLLGVEVGTPETLLARAEVIELAPGPLRVAERELVIDHVLVRGVRIRGSLPKSAPGGTQGPWLRVVVRQLELRDVEVEKLALPPDLMIAASNVEARWVGSLRFPISAAVLQAGSFTLRAPGVEEVRGHLLLWASRSPTGWTIGKARAAGRGWSVDGSGNVRDGVLHGQGRCEMDLPELERVLHLGAGLGGHAATTWKATVGGGSFRVDAKVRSERVEVVGFSFAGVDGEAHLSPDGLEATLTHAAYAGGSFEGSYVLSGFAPPWRHRIALRGRNADLALILRGFGVSDAGLTARCRVNADLVWDGPHIREGDGTAVADLEPRAGDVPAGGQVVVSLKRDGALHFNTNQTVLAGSPVRWTGTLTLGDWVPNWSVRGDRVGTTTVARLLRGWVGTEVIPPGLTGEATLDLHLRGPFSAISAVGDVAMAPVVFGPLEADGLEATFEVGGGVLNVERASVFLGTGRLLARGELRYGAGDTLRMDVAGMGLPLARVASWTGIRTPLAGRFDLTGTLGGTLEDPRASTQIKLRAVGFAGVSLGDGEGRVQVGNGVVRASNLHVGPLAIVAAVDWRRRQARVDATLSRLALAGVSPLLAHLVGDTVDCSLHGEFPLDQPAGRLQVSNAVGVRGTLVLDHANLSATVERAGAWRLAGQLRQVDEEYRGHLSFAVSSWRAVTEELMGGELPLDGEMGGEAELVIAPGGPPRLTGSVTRLTVEMEGEKATLEEPAHFTVAGSAFRLAGVTLAGPSSNLFVRVSRAADGRLAGNVAGEFPAALFSLIWRESRPRGRVELLGEILGSDQAPRFEGVARVKDGSIVLPGMPGPLTNVNGVIDLVPQMIALSKMTFFVSSGSGVCNGRVVVSPNLELDLSADVKGVRWPVTAGFAPALQGKVRIVGPLDNISVSGELVMEHTVYRREVNLQKLVVEGLMGGARVSAPSAPVTLDIAVAVPGTLEVDMPMARLTARGDLRVVGNAASPGLIGRLEVLPGAELQLSGQTYEVDRATVSFANPQRIEPYVDVLARTTVQSWDITVSLVGSLDHLTPTFTSNPPLAEMDIVALLSTGLRAQQVGQAQAGTFASSFLTEQLTGVVTNRARSLLDVDQLRVDPIVTSQSGSPAARLTVAKQLSRDWNVTVSTNLASNREEVFVSRWRLGQGLYLEATRDTEGSYALEVKWQRRY
jgi:TamB, inner membrane protein subunit of TAM complex